MSPVSTTSAFPFYPGGAIVPSAPSAVTVISKDGGATVSFRVPATSGSSYISSYVVTPYIGGTPQSATTISAGSAGTISGSTGITYLQIPVTGLTNATAYTFTVYAVNNAGAGPNPRSPARAPPVPGWCSATTSTAPCSTRNGTFTTGAATSPSPRSSGTCRPSACRRGGQPDPRRGENAALGTFLPVRRQHHPEPGVAVRGVPVQHPLLHPGRRHQHADIRDTVPDPPGIAGGMWPGLLWTEGTDYQTAWKTDPYQASWNTTGKAEIDLAEFGSSGQTSPSVSPPVSCPT